MLPRLEAEESARMANAIAFGFGSMPTERASEYASSLRSVIGGEEKPRFASPVAAAMAMGIPVKRGK